MGSPVDSRLLERALHIQVVSSGLERMPPNQARRRGQPHLPPATGCAIEPTAHISRRPRAHDAVAGQEYVASLAWFRSICSRPLDHTPRAARPGYRTVRGYEKRSDTDYQLATSGYSYQPYLCSSITSAKAFAITRWPTLVGCTSNDEAPCRSSWIRFVRSVKAPNTSTSKTSGNIPTTS